MRLKFAALLLAFVSLGAVQSAVAADLPAKAPVYKAPPPFSWTGCYLGGNVGALWLNDTWTDAASVSTGNHTALGIGVGGQVGCNYQAGAWVFGVEGMGDWAELNGNHFTAAGINQITDTNWFANATARVGYAYGSSLFYVKGGGAWINESFTSSVPGVPFATGDQTRSGWTVGGGWEYGFAPNWSIKVEYDYMDFGKSSPLFCPAAGACTTFNVEQNTHLALFGVNYRFAPWR
jgi:outer membrane immunogenic protein